jgi:integrase
MAIVAKTRKRDGVKTYYIDFRDQRGRRVREVAGTTRLQARGVLTKRLGEVRAGSYVHPQDKVEEIGPTFKEFAERFMRDYGSLRRSDHYEDRLKHLKAHFGISRIREICRADLDGFVAKRSCSVGGSTIRKDVSVLGTVFKKAVEWGVIDASPVVGLKKPPESKPRTRYLTVEEWRRFETACPPWLRPVATLAVATGLRLKEVTKLRWDDVDRQADLIHVAVDTKTGTRAVPMNRTATKVIDGVVRHLRNPYVFVDQEGKHYDDERRRNRITRWTSSVLQGAGIEGASFHTLRHTAASLMVQAGVPLYEVQKVLGHSTPLMTERYAHLQPQHLQGAVRVLDEMLGGMDTQMDTSLSEASGTASPIPAKPLTAR